MSAMRWAGDIFMALYLIDIFSSEVSTPHYSMGILLPQDPHPPQKALFCQKIESDEVVCSIGRFDLLAVTTSLKESTKGEIGPWTLSRLSPPLRLFSLPLALFKTLFRPHVHKGQAAVGREDPSVKNNLLIPHQTTPRVQPKYHLCTVLYSMFVCTVQFSWICIYVCVCVYMYIYVYTCVCLASVGRLGQAQSWW